MPKVRANLNICLLGYVGCCYEIRRVQFLKQMLNLLQLHSPRACRIPQQHPHNLSFFAPRFSRKPDNLWCKKSGRTTNVRLLYPKWRSAF